MNKEKALDALYFKRYLDTDKKVNDFFDALDVLRGNITLEDMPKLLEGLDDDSDRVDGMDELINLIESLCNDVEGFVSTFIENIYSCSNGLSYGKKMIIRMFNSEKFFIALCECIKAAEIDTDEFLDVIDEMYEEYESHTEFLDVIIAVANGEDVEFKASRKEKEVMRCSEFNREEDDIVLLGIKELEVMYNNIDKTSNTYFEDSNKIMDKESELRKLVKGAPDQKDIENIIKSLRDKNTKETVSQIPDTSNVEIPADFMEDVKKLADLHQQMKNIDYMNPDAGNRALQLGLEIGQLNLKMSSAIMHMSMADPNDPRINKMNEEMNKAMTS